VPDAVLLKPGPLNGEERKIIETHDWIGVEIVTAAFTSEPLSAIVRNHHAWYGGNKRQPDLPRGEDIPLGARILTIADAYDAIVSDRVYRKGRSSQEAFDELERWSGIQFDPVLVSHFREVVASRDASRSSDAASVPKRTALHIGLQMEKLVRALDAQDRATLGRMAERLQSTAHKHEFPELGRLSTALAEHASTDGEWCEVVEVATDLLDLCRTTQRSFFNAETNLEGEPALAATATV
jgi:hypothetical protein